MSTAVYIVEKLLTTTPSYPVWPDYIMLFIMFIMAAVGTVNSWVHSAIIGTPNCTNVSWLVVVFIVTDN